MAQKNMKQENFPVARLVKKSLRPIVIAYYQAARLADDIADNPDLETAAKHSQLATIEKNFFEGFHSQKFTGGFEQAYLLGQIFAAEELAPSLYTDLLKAFMQDAGGTNMQAWEQLIDYCHFSAAPVGRFILALYNEPPSTYLPAETLCAVLQISNHLQDLKADAITLNRCYLPQEILNQFGARTSDIYLDKSTLPLQQAICAVNDKLKKMLEDAAVLQTLLHSRRLKIQIGIIFSLTNSMLKKIDRADLLTTRVRLNWLDYLKALTFGVCRGLCVRTKQVGNRL